MIKPSTHSLAALALSIFAAASHAESGCTTVEVQNLQPQQGPLMVAAYVDEASFGKTAATALQLAVTGETMQFQMCGFTGPAVAITLFQDLNSNGKLDRNPFGMPIEPWSSSGKPAPMSAPTWATAQVPMDGTIVIKLPK